MREVLPTIGVCGVVVLAGFGMYEYFLRGLSTTPGGSALGSVLTLTNGSLDCPGSNSMGNDCGIIFGIHNANPSENLAGYDISPNVVRFSLLSNDGMIRNDLVANITLMSSLGCLFGSWTFSSTMAAEQSGHWTLNQSPITCRGTSEAVQLAVGEELIVWPRGVSGASLPGQGFALEITGIGPVWVGSVFGKIP